MTQNYHVLPFFNEFKKKAHMNNIYSLYHKVIAPKLCKSNFLFNYLTLKFH